MHDRSADAVLGIVDVAYHLPGEAVDIAEYGARHAVAPDLVERLIGNHVRHFHDGSDCSDGQLIGHAVDALCDRRGRDWLPDVAYLIHARTQPFSAPAAPMSVVNELVARFGMAPRLAFGVEQLACAGVVRAIDWACRLLRDDPQARYALVVTSDRVFGGPEWRIRQDAGVQTDGGSAILIGREDLRCAIGTISYKTFPGLHEGPSNPENCAAIARYSWHQTKHAFVEHAQAAGGSVDDVAMYMPVNADHHYWGLIADAMRVPAERFFLDNITNRGHACCNDLALNLVDGGLPVIARGGTVVYCGQSNLGIYANISFLPVAQPGAAGTAPALEAAA